MATHRPAVSAALGEFAAQLLAEREVIPRAQAIADKAAERLPGAAVAVYVYNADELPPWTVKATVGEVSVAVSNYEGTTLEELAAQPAPLLVAAGELTRERYAHLDVRRTVVALAYVPVLLDEVMLGAIEAISFDRALGESDLAKLEALTELSALGLASAITYENERNSSLESITRLTQFYDVEKVFNSTLQMDELLPIITSKITELVNVQATNLWMVEGEDLLLMSSSGVDNTIEEGASADAIIKQVAESGEPLIANPDDARITQRNGEVEEGAIFTLMAVPLVDAGALVGVLECINKGDGTEFDEDDVFFLSTVAETASSALHNSSLMEAEKKIQILEMLVEVSNEITSTLNLDRVLETLVNHPQKIIPYERAAVALDHHGKMQLKAVSGVKEIRIGDAKMITLREMLDWAASVYENELHVTAHGDTVEADRPETEARLRQYFAATGARGFYAVPLKDDQGKLGILTFESSDPDFLTETHFEIINVLAGQATVAVRNAQLYKEVPFIGVLEPIIQKKQRFMRMEKRRRTAAMVLAAAALLFLVFFPLPMRVAGGATVSPLRMTSVQAQVPGVVRKVYVHEGDAVRRGTVLAEMEDGEYRAALAAAQAKRDTALTEMNRSLANNDGSEAGVQRIQANFWTAEVARAQERLDHAKLRAAAEGIVATPHVEDLVGKQLDVGDLFAQVVDSSRATLDVSVEESDVALVRPGDSAAVKLESFPTRTFRGRVMVVSPVTTPWEDHRVFFARVEVPNEGGLIRPGMQGRSKVSVGWHSAGYVIFRNFGMWAWGKLWGWFGW